MEQGGKNFNASLEMQYESLLRKQQLVRRVAAKIERARATIVEGEEHGTSSSYVSGYLNRIGTVGGGGFNDSVRQAGPWAGRPVRSHRRLPAALSHK